MTISTSPYFSVVIPWHRNEDQLKRAIASIEGQTERDLEIIVVCNGPAAGQSAQIVSTFAIPHLTAVDSAAADANAARNAGIDHARGKWIAFLDADDEFHIEKLGQMRKALEADGTATLLLSRGMRVRGDGAVFTFPTTLFDPQQNIAEYFFSAGNNCSTTAIVVRSDLARRVRFTDGLRKFQDNDFLIRAQAAGAAIHMLPQPLYFWHDATAEGRISRGTDFDRQIAWARALSPSLTDAAFHAFCSRRVAQYIFPGDFGTSTIRLWNGWWKGKIPLTDTLMFVLRALLPAKLAWWAVGLHSRLRQPRQEKFESTKATAKSMKDSS